MSNYISRAEIDEISEGLIKVYSEGKGGYLRENVNIEDFITSFLKLKIVYANFAEDDPNKLGFLADGTVPLKIVKDGKKKSYVFPKGTIIIDYYLKRENETGRRRFTLAHEAAHYILDRANPVLGKAHFHNEYDEEKVYTFGEIVKLLNSAEWQADTMAASLLMPHFVVNNAMSKFTSGQKIKVYGRSTFCTEDKIVLRTISEYLGVSYSSLIIRLRNLGMFEKRSMSEFVVNHLNFGGGN